MTCVAESLLIVEPGIFAVTANINWRSIDNLPKSLYLELVDDILYDRFGNT